MRFVLALSSMLLVVSGAFNALACIKACSDGYYRAASLVGILSTFQFISGPIIWHFFG